MGTVRLWFSVYQHTCPMGSSELWTRKITTDFAPRAGDRLHISYNPEEDESGCLWSVRNHYWDHDGSYHCEMTHLVLDPTEEQQNSLTRDRREPPYVRAWWSDRDGPPEEMLRRSGWQTWKEWRDGGTSQPAD